MKYIGVLLISFLTTVTIAQNVPNGNFENWDTEDFFVTNDWVSYGKPHRSSESMTGQYAITLENYETSPNTYNSSSIYNVDWIDGEVDKFPYDGDPLSMVFYANYILHT